MRLTVTANKTPTAPPTEVVCVSCGTTAPCHMEGCTPVGPEDWQTLFGLKGWEHECPLCWVTYLAKVKARELSDAA